MLTMPRILWVLLLAGSFAMPALAEDIASTGQSTAASTGVLSNVQKYATSNYLLWLTGPRTEALSGNKDGKGTNLTIFHFFTLGAKLSPEIKLNFTQPVTQLVNEEADQTKKKWQPTDPYLTLSDSKIFHSDRYAANLDGYLRYYIPISRGTSDAVNVGSARENGLGLVRIALNPSKTFLDGKLTFNGLVLGAYRFNKLSSQERFNRQTTESLKNSKIIPTTVRDDGYLILDPSVVYSVTKKVDVYVEWATGYLRHTTDGKWSSINHPDDGAYLSPGIYWNPTKKVSLNPYLSYQLGAPADARGLTKMDVGLQAQYTFL